MRIRINTEDSNAPNRGTITLMAVAAAKGNSVAGSPTKFLAVMNPSAVQIEMGDGIDPGVCVKNLTSERMRSCGDPLTECSKKAKSLVSETCPSAQVLGLERPIVIQWGHCRLWTSAAAKNLGFGEHTLVVSVEKMQSRTLAD